MNLVDLLDAECVIGQDSWSLTKPRFGTDLQLEVCGVMGKTTHTIYLVKCNTCAKDPELFGDGYFKSMKTNLVKGAVPCGCSIKPEWTKEQYETLLRRSALNKGYEFNGIKDFSRGAHSKISLTCSLHGEWDTCDIKRFIWNNTAGCPVCAGRKKSISKRKTDEFMINSFLTTNQFPDGTEFWRSEKKTSSGRSTYW